MALRGKLVVIVGIALAVFGVLAVAVQQVILLPRFMALEDQAALEDMRRCVLAVRRESEFFGRYCLDWAAWDDTYNFVQGRLPSYVQNNLSEATFATQIMTLFYAVRDDGAVTWSRIWGDERRGASPMMETFPRDVWPPDHPLLAAIAADGFAQGVMNTPEGPMFIAAQPIVTSLTGSPPAGALVMGRRIDAEMAERLRERTGVPFSIRPALEGAAGAAGFRPLGEAAGEAVFAKPSDDGASLNLRAILHDFRGEPTFVLTATVPRPIFDKGRETMRYTSITLLLAGALVIVAVMGSVQAIVVRPLGALARSLVAVRTSGDLSARADMKRRDELGALANEFNGMMTRLEEDHRSRLASEHLLRSREAELSALFAAAPDAIVTFDAKGRILSVNAACRTTFGFGGADLVGRNVTVLVPELLIPENGGLSLADAPPVADDGRELAGVRAGGGRFPVHVRVSAVPGEAHFFVAIIRDITALNRLHEDLAQSKHLAQIGEMSASIAHEIRNPLAAISAVLQVFRDGLPKDDARREVLAEVFGQIRRLDGAVHNLLMFARPWTPELQPCALAALAADAIADARKKPEFAGIDIELSDASRGAVAPADPLLMSQVLWNILENAAQAVEGRGAIRCTVERENGSMRLRIRDSGRGLAPGAEDNLFRPFYTTRTRGTGLGLPVCRRIMAAHGGSISIANHREGGAEVTLLLPTGNPDGRERTDS